MRKEARNPGRSQTENLPRPVKFVFSLGVVQGGVGGGEDQCLL